MTVNLIIGGASKAGSTAIYDILRQNNAFFLPQRKELHYFSRSFLEKTVTGPGDKAVFDEIPSSFIDYLSYYDKKKPSQVAVDVSPSYLFHHDSAELIARTLPDVKVIFLLRRPEDKVFSQYMHLLGEGREKLNFEEGLKQELNRKALGFADMWLYRESGYYADAIANFQDTLGPDKVKVFLFDDFIRDPDVVLREICKFVGLKDSQVFDTNLKSNVSGSPRSLLLAQMMSPNRFTNFLRRRLPPGIGAWVRRRLRILNTGTKPKLSCDTRTELGTYYNDDIIRLEKLIGRSTGWRSASNDQSVNHKIY